MVRALASRSKPSLPGRGRASGHRRLPPSNAPTVGIVGVGYMGIATGLAFAHRGRRVVAYDVNPRVRKAIRSGRSPYREDGLTELLRAETKRGRFVVVDGLDPLCAVSECIFLCVPTPPGRAGRADLGPLRSAVRDLAASLRTVRGYRLVVVKSTVVPGTTDTVVAPLLRRGTGKGARSLGVATNPEFLSEGRMVEDALHPERIVVGTSDRKSLARISAVYEGFDAPVLVLPPSGAELVKYAANAFLALKVSFANELSRWTEALGGNIDDVVGAVGADPRIGPAFLRAGPGFGGSCFEKDLRAFVGRAQELGLRVRTAETALDINADQTAHALELVRQTAGTLRGRTVAVLGLAFKAGTDDIRESRAFPIVEGLLASGARVRVHDPSALRNFRREWRRRSGTLPSRLTFCPSVDRALLGANLAVLQSDWPEYLAWPRRWTDRMRSPVVVDLRRALRPEVRDRAGVRLVALGVGTAADVSASGDPAPRRPR
ncbi:MAG: nucleotide sugar dehydrogenase [Thermoplasmata archaeon]